MGICPSSATRLDIREALALRTNPTGPLGNALKAHSPSALAQGNGGSGGGAGIEVNPALPSAGCFLGSRGNGGGVGCTEGFARFRRVLSELGRLASSSAPLALMAADSPAKSGLGKLRGRDGEAGFRELATPFPSTDEALSCIGDDALPEATEGNGGGGGGGGAVHSGAFEDPTECLAASPSKTTACLLSSGIILELVSAIFVLGDGIVDVPMRVNSKEDSFRLAALLRTAGSSQDDGVAGRFMSAEEHSPAVVGLEE